MDVDGGTVDRPGVVEVGAAAAVDDSVVVPDPVEGAAGETGVALIMQIN